MKNLAGLIFVLAMVVFITALMETSLAQNESALENSTNNTHTIVMSGVALQNGYAYKMQSHTIQGIDGNTQDVTGRYDTSRGVIPGPTIIISEGDEVFLTIKNEIGSGCLSVHVHGLHYSIESDGTRQRTNGVSDQCATGTDVDQTYTYHWTAAKGSVGTWPYHDHALFDSMGSEDEGLFGAIIVNADVTKMYSDGEISDLSVADIDKEIVVYLVHSLELSSPQVDTMNFWIAQIQNADGVQTDLGVNPEIHSTSDEILRFHLIGMGSISYEFRISDHSWLQPGTENITDVIYIGPLERNVFTTTSSPGSYSITAYGTDTFFDQSILTMTSSLIVN